ncbi:MAG: hypothetical protein RLZZ28_2716, partial [Bacteroidota bacterium]
VGKEWKLRRRKPSTISLDIKLIENGGVRVTPIDLPKSIAAKTTVLNNSRIYEEKLNPIFRLDLQTEWKVQYSKMTGSFILGVQNITNQKNQVSQRYDPAFRGIRYNYLLGLIPVLGYKIDLSY